jgi:hypothetical protein
VHWPRDTLYLQKLALTSSTRGGLSVGIVRLRTKATEFSFYTEVAIRAVLRERITRTKLKPPGALRSPVLDCRQSLQGNG